MIEEIDFQAGELRIDADYWAIVEPVVKGLEKVFAAISVDGIPNVDLFDVGGLNLLFTPVGLIAFLAANWFEIIPVRILRGSATGTLTASGELKLEK